MTNSKGFFALLLLLSTVGVLAGVAKERGVAAQQVQLATEATKQSATQRIFQEGSYVETWSQTGDQETELYGPLRAKLDHRDHVYLMDYGDYRIKELDPSGTPVRVYGTGKGQGPEELLSLSDIEVLDNGEVWASDPGTGRVSVFGPDGRLTRTLRAQPRTYRLAQAPGGGFFTNLPIGSARLLGRYDSEGKVEEEFGTLLENQAEHSLALDGWIESDGRLGLVYAARVSTVLAAYNPDASQRFLVRTIEPFALPKVRHDSEKTWIDPDARRSAISLSVNGDEISVFSYFIEGVKRRGAIDVYRWSDGKYLYSRRIPAECGWLTVGDDYVVTTMDSTVTKWRWQPAEPQA